VTRLRCSRGYNGAPCNHVRQGDTSHLWLVKWSLPCACFILASSSMADPNAKRGLDNRELALLSTLNHAMTQRGSFWTRVLRNIMTKFEFVVCLTYAHCCGDATDRTQAAQISSLGSIAAATACSEAVPETPALIPQGEGSKGQPNLVEVAALWNKCRR